MKLLIFFTSKFPFGQGENFIESEIHFLADSFDKILLISNDTTSECTRSYPNNIEIKRLPYHLTLFEKITSLRYIFGVLFWKEFKTLFTKYKLWPSKGIFFTMLASLAKGENLKKEVNRCIQEYSQYKDIAVYAYWANDMAFGISLIENSSVSKKICRAHAGDVYFERSAYNYLPFRDFLYKKLDHICFISEIGKKYSIEKLKNNYDSFEVARLGINNSQPYKEKLFNDNYLHIASCSFLKPVKRVHIIIEALSLFPDELPVYWEHYGGGELEGELQELADKLLSSRQNVQFTFHGYLSNEEVYEHYNNNKIDVFLNVSESEGIPVSIMEALSFGIPVLATNVGGTSEIVNDNHGKLLPENITPVELANELMLYYNLSKSEKKELSKNAYEFWEVNYNATINYPKFIQTYLS
ncbi:glycosyltransferase [Rapidithrix thailandica]|uniref:Glycosyltransferase n=1 Tax=Rapidithrix thailandica TaxID=413964 RepID=A0AAW9S0I8_9BACT